MDELITKHPELFAYVTSGLISMVVVLLTAFFRMFTTALRDLTLEVKAIRKEFKADREKDRVLTGSLLDRMQRQETICEQHREHCPWDGNGGGCS